MKPINWVKKEWRDERHDHSIIWHIWMQYNSMWIPEHSFTSHPWAMAKPPPSNRMIFQGTASWAFFHDRRGTYGTFEAEGTFKNLVFSAECFVCLLSLVSSCLFFQLSLKNNLAHARVQNRHKARACKCVSATTKSFERLSWSVKRTKYTGDPRPDGQRARSLIYIINIP